MIIFEFSVVSENIMDFPLLHQYEKENFPHLHMLYVIKALRNISNLLVQNNAYMLY